ncbi:triose-phosphate isomerase [Dethiosulfatarculus sandiegensis]|uniref:Histone-lysine N-methyltransferase n=1 Tax=Dethiosulfatarculus sandiegensis TaxID=1429043 RepID=A0A0D2G9B7_9BACT|nr:cache domain-containing protein [Dethiosulfatarculus sandiegensis]KIX11452.1 histone-lysine N-methyltransferase [Dethiosulfatarculus sandiegensis]
MAKWNARRRLLDHTHGVHVTQLTETKEPNLMREVFPYTDVCRIDFDYKVQPLDPPDEMLITDTTFRDGQQARPPYKAEQIVAIYDLMHRLSGPKGIIRQSEFFLYSEKDREAVRKCQELGHRFPEITGWVRANKDELKVVKELNLKETGILTSVSDYHIFLKLGLDRKKALDKYLGVVKDALDMGIRPRCHFEDITRADIYGFVVPFGRELAKLREESGVDIKIRLCDTMGYGVTYPGSALPRSVPKLVRAIIEDASCPGMLMEWHGHNDFYKVLINATTAWLYGCGAANGTLLGFGERTGNTPLEALVMEYISLKGKDDGMDPKVITEIADYFTNAIGYHIPPATPFVGRDFNSTSAGIHADGLMKNPEIYNIFDTEAVLDRPYSIAITDKSGLAGVVHWLNQRLKLKDDAKVDKRHPGVQRIYNWVKQQYEDGRLTTIGNAEMEVVSRKHLPQMFVSEFDRLKKHAIALAHSIGKDLIEREELKTMAPAMVEPLLEDYLEANPFIQFMYMVNDQGYMVTKNITHITDRAKYGRASLDVDYSDRDWFIQPMKDGKVYVSDFYTSRFTNALCITVSGPVRNTDDRIVGILGADIRLEELLKMEAKEANGGNS